MRTPRVTMPRWPAYLMGAFAAACVYPAATMPPREAESFRATGHEPGWNLAISGERMDFVGDHGGTRIAVARPDPLTTFNGRRYETARLVVDVTHARCDEAMSGQRYQHQVTIIADGRTIRGCGGPMRPE